MNSKCIGTGLRRKAPGFSAIQSVGPRHDLTDAVFHAVSHDVNAAHTFDLAHLFNEVDTQIDSLLLLIFCSRRRGYARQRALRNDHKHTDFMARSRQSHSV